MHEQLYIFAKNEMIVFERILTVHVMMLLQLMIIEFKDSPAISSKMTTLDREETCLFYQTIYIYKRIFLCLLIMR